MTNTTLIASVPRLPQLKAWSFSGLVNWENCPRSQYYRKILKIKDVSGVAAARGSDIHKEMENYLNCTSDIYPPSLPDKSYWLPILNKHRKNPNLHTEIEFAFDKKWQVVGYTKDPRAWFRMIIDVAILPVGGKTATLIDIKTGKTAHNDVKHLSQLRLYAVACFKMYPKLEKVKLALWYVDHKKVLQKTMFRSEALLVERSFIVRSSKMLADKQFRAKPSVLCNYCSYEDRCDYAWSKRI